MSCLAASSNLRRRVLRSTHHRMGSSRPEHADVYVALRAADEWGVLSWEELRACGLSCTEIKTRARNGRLHRKHRGVYAIGHPRLPLEGRLLAAVKACGPAAVLSHRSAAVLWQLLDPDPAHRPEVTVLGVAPRRHPGIRTHRTGSLGTDEVRRHRGIPVTAPIRTLLDLAAVVDARVLRRATRAAQSSRLVHHSPLIRAVGDQSGRRGIRKLRQILASGPAPTRSELEDVVLDLIVRGGFARPDINVPLLIAGRRIIPDFRWPECQLVVEADGAAWHDHPLARRDDAARQALLEAHGERVLRVTWEQAVARPAETLARLEAAAAPRIRTRS